jgi:hypothetical protein
VVLAVALGGTTVLMLSGGLGLLTKVITVQGRSMFQANRAVVAAVQVVLVLKELQTEAAMVVLVLLHQSQAQV